MSRREDINEDDATKVAKMRHNCKIAAIILISITVFIFVLTIILAVTLDIGNEAIYSFLTFLGNLFYLSLLSSIILALIAVDWDKRRKEREAESRIEIEKESARARKKAESSKQSSDVEDEFWGSNRETPEDEMFRLSMWDMLDEIDDNEDD